MESEDIYCLLVVCWNSSSHRRPPTLVQSEATTHTLAPSLCPWAPLSHARVTRDVQGPTGGLVSASRLSCRGSPFPAPPKHHQWAQRDAAGGCGCPFMLSAQPTEEQSCSHKRETPSCSFWQWYRGNWWVLKPWVFGLLCTCLGALGSICTWPAAPEGWPESPDHQNTLPTGSVALKSVLMNSSLSSLGFCLSHWTLLHPAGRKPGDGRGRDSEVPVSHCWAADYHINVQCPTWVLAKGQYIFNWKYKGLLMAQLELGGFMFLPLDGIEGNGMIHWAVCTSPDLLPIIYIPLKSISAEGHSQPEFFHVKSFLSQTYCKARKDSWQPKLGLRLLILILWLGERRL